MCRPYIDTSIYIGYIESKIKYKIVTTIVKKHLKKPKGVTRRRKKGQTKKDYRKFDYFRRM